MQSYNKYKKQYQKDQQTFISFDKLYRESSQDILFDKIDFESLCNVFTKFLDETKIKNFFVNMSIKVKLIYFINEKNEIQLRSWNIDKFCLKKANYSV